MWRILCIGISLAALGYSQIDYARDVAPIFQKNCYGCHGPAAQTSGFRLDDGVAALKGGYGGAAIVPGKPEASALIARVSAAGGVPVMPPGSKGLRAADVETLRKWIAEGAVFAPGSAAKPVSSGRALSKHWAFQPVAAADPSRGIDSHVRAYLAKQGVKPAPEAARRTLLRRLTLDLTGLLPDPEDLAAFEADPRADAYERQVDRLLASPHFGEKWARSWLDQARYADSDGYEKDWFRPWAWRWRNWVIDSINRDQPFDQFSIEQIAGDLLPGATMEQQLASGFHRNTLTNREGGVDDNQFRFEATLDRANTVATVWLGLSMGCAQCHDHKYDPISQKDYYSLFALFDNMEEIEIDAPLPGEVGPWLRGEDEYQAKRAALLKEYNVAALQAAWEKEIRYTIEHPGERTDWDLAWDCVQKLTESGDGGKIVRIPPDQRTAREQSILTDHFVRNYHFAVGNKVYKELKLGELDGKLTELRKQFPRLSQAMVVAEARAPKRHFLRVRGDYKTNGIEVAPQSPAVLGLIEQPRVTRLDFARWLFRPEHPLTARVAVNRIWQELFGAPLVRTPDDFGTRADAPANPELLDHLAARFRDGGWSRKALIREIVLSDTYRQSSQARPELRDRDPNNEWLARQSRLRLPAELIRDAALRASGLLHPAIGGRSIRPPQPAGVMELSYASRYKGTAWEESAGLERYRRGLYVQFLRTTPYPQLMNFDAPKATVAACRRDRSNTPLQALNLLNDPVFVEAAQALALRVLTAPGASFGDRLGFAYQWTVGRPPEASETARLQAYFDVQRRLLADDLAAQTKLAPTAAPGSTRLETAVWTGIASVLLNLDEFITRE